MPELEIGSVFAGHRIEGVAGRGGMGVVYRARHLALDHDVAMKVISAQLAGDEVFRERFRSESRIAVSIRHPNVVPIHHAGEEDGLIFVTMDLIEGTDLRRLLNREGKLDPERAVALVSQAAAALDAAHAKGLVHRDVKPGNILIEERGEGEHAYLTDFGLTKRIEATSGVTATGAFVGTLDYVAPEQIKGARVDARTDVYALGCVLYELLTGQPPFAGTEEKVAKIYAHLQEEPPPLLARGRDIPEGLDEVVARALAKEPKERYPSAGDLARAARAALVSQPVTVAEHTVATGAAAPDSDPAATVAAPPPEEIDAAEEEPAKTPGPRSAETAAAPKPNRREGARIPGTPALLLGLVTIAGVIVLVAALAGGGGGGSSSTTSPTGPTTTTAGPPPKGQYVDTYPLDPSVLPVELSVGFGQVWVTSRVTNGQVVEVNANTGESTHSFTVGNKPEGIAVGPGMVWVANSGDGTVQSINPRNQTVGTPLTVGSDPRAVAYGDNYFWVANSGSSTISRVNPRSDQVESAYMQLPGGEPHGMVVQGKTLYVVDRTGQDVQSFDVSDGSKIAEGAVGNNPKDVAYADGKVWVTNPGPDDGSANGTVSVLDARTLKPVQPDIKFGVGSLPRGIVAYKGSVWVALGGSGEVAQIDPGSAQKKPQLIRQEKAHEADGIAAGGAIWTVNGAEHSISRIDPAPPPKSSK